MGVVGVGVSGEGGAGLAVLGGIMTTKEGGITVSATMMSSLCRDGMVNVRWWGRKRGVEVQRTY